MGNGPGALTEYDDLAEKHPRLHGGFIWEWRDHGLLTRTPDGTEFYGYGGDFGEVVHDGTFVMDGMVLSDGTPTPGLAEFALVNAPVVLSVDGDRLTVQNRYHTLTTDHLRFVGLVEVDGEPTCEQPLDVLSVAPGEALEVALPETLITAAGGDGERWLYVRAELAEPTLWANAGHVVSWSQCAIAAPKAMCSGQDRQPKAEPFHRLGTPSGRGKVAELDPRTGRLTSLFGLSVDGPWLELWRAPTDNDRSSARGSFELGSPEDTLGEGVPGPSSESRWRARGLDRLVHRVGEVVLDGDRAAVRTRSSAANSTLGVDTCYRWQFGDHLVDLTVEIVPTGPWDCSWPRVGVRLDLPPELDRAEWFGTGPAESYPDTARAVRVGRFGARLATLNVRYARPQETGHRGQLRWLRLPGLQIETRPDRHGQRPGFTLSRHTPQQIDRSPHPHELPTSHHSYLFLDAAVHGVGSRACGIDVLPKHALWPGAYAFTVRFRQPK